MAAITCKRCGANLPLTEGASVVECEFCGVKQTVPSADSEKKLALFGRANRLRFSCEFDKAAGVYEAIVAEFPTEAEAYWGLVLCKYGIEYVDDPATGRKIPTCHRSSFDSVMDDGDFEQVMENADPIARSVYREEAEQIEELRKGILEASGKEEPYDIFICYKETAENGDRTLDSVIAQDVYDTLTEKGYRVFFSRVTLEDKLGQEYEPYIFAALNSAKVMLAFGTDYEYYNAVWVKNEWSRFLQLIAKGEKKTLIPCYKGLDAYDMPKEFAKLQAQDMGKVGAIQDLLRGIEKLLPRNSGKEKGAETEKIIIQQAALQSVMVETLMQRVHLHLEDGEWSGATECCNRILDIAPQNADAYVGLLMAELRAKKEQDLGTGDTDFSENNHYNKALRFASPERKAALEQYRARVVERIEEKKRIEEEKQREIKRIAEQYRLRLEPTRKIAETTSKFISCGDSHTVGLQSDGTVKADGVNTYEEFDLFGWHDITAVACGPNHTIGLKSNGTVVATGKNDFGQCNVSEWGDIVAISCGRRHTVGLKADGSVLATGVQFDVSDWCDIVAISCGDRFVVGLKSDGTVVATGVNQYGQCKVSDWRDIVAISCGAAHTVGLKLDGSVVATGKNDEKQCDVSDWSDIVAVSCNEEHTIGLKLGGSVVATGKNDTKQCNVSDWSDIVAVSSGKYHTVGLKSDGRVKATGKYAFYHGSTWKMFDDLAHIDDERKAKTEYYGRRAKGLCQYCGGEFSGVFSKKCSVCGKPKDY